MALTKKKQTNKSEIQFPTRDRDLPATQGMLQLVRTELKAEMKSGFKQVDARFNQVDARFEQVLSEVARIGVLVEEQNSRNRIVMEGLTGLFQRQERLELKVDESENLVQSIAARSRR